MVLTWGASGCSHTFGCPIHLDTPICLDPLTTPICSNTHHMPPMTSCASACSGRNFMSFRDVGNPLLFGHPHVFGCFPMCPTPLTHLYAPRMSLCSRGYLHVLSCVMEETSYMFRVWGISTSVRLLVSVGIIHWMSVMLQLVPFL